MGDTINYDSMRRAGVGIGAAKSKSSDPIERIITSKHLPPDIKAQFSDRDLCNRITKKSNELLRQLRAKVPPKIGRYDTPETRAAVVLEFVLRTGIIANENDASSGGSGRSTKAVQLHVLARQLGVRKQYAEEVQSALGHYLDDIASGGSRRGSTAAAAAAAVGGGDASNKFSLSGRPVRGSAAAAAAVMSNSIGQPEIIHDLAIRIGSMVPDAEGSARRGEVLFAALARHVANSGDRFSRDARRSDLKRNKAAYEAACFYVSVNEAEGGASVSGGKKAATAAGTEGQSDEEEERVLSVAYVASAARLSKKAFEGIVREVTKIAAEIKSDRAAAAQKERKKREREQEKAKTGGKQSSSSSKRPRNASQMSHLDLVAGLERRGGDEESSSRDAKSAENTREPPHRPVYSPSAEFLAWKKRTLNDAIEEARKSAGGKELSKKEALEWAVKDVIARQQQSLASS